MANLVIPTVDLSPLLATVANGHKLQTAKDSELKNSKFVDCDAKKKAKDQINQACSEFGFFQVVNHGIPLDLMNKSMELSKTFFTYPEQEKLKYRTKPGAPLPSGYSKQPDDSPDKNEFLAMYPPGSSFNMLPTNPPGTKEVLEEIFLHYSNLASTVESFINECLGLPPNFLKEYNDDRSTDFLVCLHYLPATEDGNSGKSDHEDGNVITFVFQDEVGGLEVYHDGQWIPIPPAEGTLIVNIGDAIQVMSNNKYKSATHRVVRPKGRTRASFAFFYNLHGDKWIEPLPQFTTEIGEPPKYRGFYYKDYVKLRVLDRIKPPSRVEDRFKVAHYAIST